MFKHIHEIRDPIHVFVSVNSHERRVLDSRPFQRLRHIHQLALSSLVYPGATHKRFEHSLGVMELAGRVFDIVTRQDKVTDPIKEVLPEITETDTLSYWKRHLRMAALCHDIGHLPFSHAAEKELLPANWDHERLTRALILSDEMLSIWESMTPSLRPEVIVKLAVGPIKAKDLKFSNWEAILAEIIVGDAFGVDRVDYLLRDSYHAGVQYGRFDHHRLIDTLRILPPPSPSDEDDTADEPSLGIEVGGLHTAEALALARYFMYSQVYFHPVRRSYDIHLKDFMKEWLPGGSYPTSLQKHLKITDNDVWSAILKAADSPKSKGHQHAKRIVNRDHFRVLYTRNPVDIQVNPNSVENVYDAVCEKFGAAFVRYDKYTPGTGGLEFPVLMNDQRIASSVSISEILQQIPAAKFEYVFIAPDLKGEAQKWLESERESIITTSGDEEGA